MVERVLRLTRRNALKTAGAVSAIGVAGCLSGDDQMSFSIGTANQGSSADNSALALQRAVNDHSENLSITPQQTNGFVSNIRLYNDGEIPAIATDSNSLVSAINGDPPFEEKPVEVLPGQGFHYAAIEVYLMAREGSGLESSDDIDESHTIYPGQPGTGLRAITDEIWENAGLFEQAGDVININFTDLSGAISEGRVDAFILYGENSYSKAGWIDEVEASNDIYTLELGDDLLNAIEETTAARSITLRPEDHNWEQDITKVTEEMRGWAYDAHWYFGDDVENDAVYELARISHEHIDTVQEAHPAYPDHGDPELMTTAISGEVPIHEGFAEFLKENDLWNDEWDEGNEMTL